MEKKVEYIELLKDQIKNLEKIEEMEKKFDFDQKLDILELIGDLSKNIKDEKFIKNKLYEMMIDNIAKSEEDELLSQRKVICQTTIFKSQSVKDNNDFVCKLIQFIANKRNKVKLKDDETDLQKRESFNDQLDLMYLFKKNVKSNCIAKKFLKKKFKINKDRQNYFKKFLKNVKKRNDTDLETYCKEIKQHHESTFDGPANSLGFPQNKIKLDAPQNEIQKYGKQNIKINTKNMTIIQLVEEYSRIVQNKKKFIELKEFEINRVIKLLVDLRINIHQLLISNLEGSFYSFSKLVVEPGTNAYKVIELLDKLFKKKKENKLFFLLR